MNNSPSLPSPAVRTIIFCALFLLNAYSASALELGLPARCELGKTCFIQNYPDHDSTRDFKDYTCGNILGYDGHDGTDFRLIDYDAMRKGVDVVAVADGVVLATRDGMVDISIRKINRKTIKNKECGNGIVLRHADNIDTQVCHLKKNSIIVSKDQQVRAGEKLGEIGLSGLTEFPHVHLSVRTDKGEKLDPFTSKAINDKCTGNTPLIHTLWKPELLPQLTYQQGGILAYGFSDHEVNYDTVLEGAEKNTSLPSTAPALAMWVSLYGVQPRDTLTLSIKDEKGRTIAERSVNVNRAKATSFQLTGKKRQRDVKTWEKGNYYGTFTWRRGTEVYKEIKQTLSVN